MAEDHGAPEAGQVSKVWTKDSRDTESYQRAQIVRSCTVQNKVRGVLGRVSAGAAGRILNSANPREVKI